MKPDGIKVTIKPERMTLLRRMAAERSRKPAAMNRQIAVRPRLTLDELGICGEAVVAEVMGTLIRQLPAHAARKDGYDLALPDGRTVAVRTTFKRQGHFIMPGDVEEFPANLGVLVWPTAKPDTFEIAGWFTREDWACFRSMQTFTPGRLDSYMPHHAMRPAAELRQPEAAQVSMFADALV